MFSNSKVVGRLRKFATMRGEETHADIIEPICTDAANTITTLERQLATAREALEFAIDELAEYGDRPKGSLPGLGAYHAAHVVILKARAALTPGVSDAE
jgi:hypothetical protein